MICVSRLRSCVRDSQPGYENSMRKAICPTSRSSQPPHMIGVTIVKVGCEKSLPPLPRGGEHLASATFCNRLFSNYLRFQSRCSSADEHLAASPLPALHLSA